MLFRISVTVFLISVAALGNCVPSSFAAAAADKTNGSDLIQRFEREYPAAADRLAAAAAVVAAQGNYAETHVNGDATRKDKVDFQILRDNSKISWQIVLNPEKTRFADVIGEHGAAFTLKASPGGTYQVVGIGNRPSDEMRQRMSQYCWRFLLSTQLLWDFRTLRSAMEQQDLIIDSASPDPKHSDWIQLAVHYRNRDKSGQLVAGKVGKGTLTLSPADDWAIREYAYDWPGDTPVHMVAHVDVRHETGLGVVPTTYDFQSTPASAKEPNETYQCTFTKFALAKPAASDFTLAAFNLDDPRQGPPLAKMIMIIGAVIVLLAILCTMLAKQLRANRSRRTL